MNSHPRYNFIISVRMQLSHCKPRSKQRKSRMRTLCTLDTFDVNFADSFYRRGKENDQRSRNCPFQMSQTRSATNKKASAQHQRSQFSAYNCSRVRETSNKKGQVQRAMSISQSAVNRVKTDYSEIDPNRGGASITKKLLFPTEETYKFDCWQVVRAIIETKQQEILQGYQQPNKKEKCVLIKTKNIAIKREYERQIKAWTHLQKFMKPKQKNLFLRVRKVFKDKKEWMIVTDNYYHPNWHNDQFYMFASKLKTNHPQMNTLVKEIAKAIDLLSKNGYAHSAISIQNLYFPISRGELQAGQLPRLGGLRHAFRIDSKEAFLSMPTLFRTPPEILNFISFECREEFERDYLDVIGRVEAGWQIDMWSLGVLILQILNGGSLTGEGSDRGQMISLQKELPIRYSYLLSNMEGRLRSLVLQMLSPDPQKRPHPRQVLRLL